MLWDSKFYDPAKGLYTVEPFLDNAREEFGGFDSIVLWQAYPQFGADDRNQFDFYRDMPGGLEGLRSVVRMSHARGVRVFIVYNPWDTGTRREGMSDNDALVAVLTAVEADGVFLDTMAYGSEELRSTLEDVSGGLVLEGEDVLPIHRIHDHHMSWAQYFRDGAVPGILRNKWFERRHMQHQTDRWNFDRTSQLHTAWMNGSGMLVWDNIFGSLVPWNPRDRSFLRMVLPIQRRYAGLFSGEGWTPLVATEKPDLFASRWELDDVRLWTCVNRSNEPIDGVLIQVPHGEDLSYFDLIQGTEIRPIIRQGKALLTGSIFPNGAAGLLAGTRSALGNDFEQFLHDQKQRYARYDRSTSILPVTVLRASALHGHRAVRTAPVNMAEIPAARFHMRVEFQTRECGFYGDVSDVPLLFPNLFKPYSTERIVTMPQVAIDLTPVTNAEYYEFLKDSTTAHSI
jgi:hypothetical protein